MLTAGLVAPGSALAGQLGAERKPEPPELTFNRMVEALQRAEHALNFAHGHDGEPEYSYPLDFSKELRFIDETLKLTEARSRPLAMRPLPAVSELR